MSWLTDEILFYGGMIVAGGSFLMAILYFCVAKVQAVKLEAQLNAEYGEKGAL